jgi:hypothetical protein
MEKQKIVYDYSRLKGRIREIFNTQEAFALAVGLSERSLSLKLSSARGWKQDQIMKAIEVLGLTEEDIQPYFFTIKVQRCEL